MKVYLEAAVEKAMKIQEVILRAIDKQITWLQAAEIIRVSARQLRRWRAGWEKYGYDGLFDRRLGKPSPKRVALETVAEVLRLYREKYAGLSVQHFHEKLEEEHQIKLSYTWVKKALQGAGLVEKEAKRGVHRKKRERRPIPGLLLHIDASKHQWFQDERWHDLIVIMDDATSEVYYAQLVDEESTRTVMAALREVIEQKGAFCALYTDRASHFFHTPKAGDVVDRQRLTQLGRALAELKIEMIAAYSPQARGRSERNFGTWQGRLPQELALKGITTVDEANQFLRQTYIAVFNRKFSVAAAQTGNAFLPVNGHDLDLVFSMQYDRVAGKDNTVRVANLCLQIERTSWRNSLTGCRVKVHQHFDDTFTILYAGRIVGRYSDEGAPIEEKKAMEKWKPQKEREYLLVGIPTFPQPLLPRLKNQTGHIVCYKSGHLNLLVTGKSGHLGGTRVVGNGIADFSPQVTAKTAVHPALTSRSRQQIPTPKLRRLAEAVRNDRAEMTRERKRL